MQHKQINELSRSAGFTAGLCRGEQSVVYRCRAEWGWGGGVFLLSCGTDRPCHCENKQMDPWGGGAVWLVLGLSPLPSDPTMFVEPVLLSSNRVYFSIPWRKWTQLSKADL